MMSDYTISQIYPSDRRALAQVDSLLSEEGLKRDANLDYTCAMYDRDALFCRQPQSSGRGAFK